MIQSFFFLINTYGSVYGTGDSVKESWPATTGVEFGGRFVQRSSTSCTIVDAFVVYFVVFSCSWIPTLMLLDLFNSTSHTNCFLMLMFKEPTKTIKVNQNYDTKIRSNPSSKILISKVHSTSKFKCQKKKYASS